MPEPTRGMGCWVCVCVCMYVLSRPGTPVGGGGGGRSEWQLGTRRALVVPFRAMILCLAARALSACALLIVVVVAVVLCLIVASLARRPTRSLLPARASLPWPTPSRQEATPLLRHAHPQCLSSPLPVSRLRVSRAAAPMPLLGHCPWLVPFGFLSRPLLQASFPRQRRML